MAKSLSDLQRYILRRAAENDGLVRYEEIIRNFYRLPRSAFPELRIAEAAISRSVRALVRRRLAIVVHLHKWTAAVKLKPAGVSAARPIPPSRTLPRAKRIGRMTAADRLPELLWRRGYRIEHLRGNQWAAVELETGQVNELTQKEHEQLLKARIRRRGVARLRARNRTAHRLG